MLGLDLSPEAAAIAARENGVQVVTATLAGACFPDASFGVVTMFHVLEHVLDPCAVLTEVHRVLRPGGRVVLQVPNIDSWQSRLFGPKWWGLHGPVTSLTSRLRRCRRSSARAGSSWNASGISICATTRRRSPRACARRSIRRCERCVNIDSGCPNRRPARGSGTPCTCCWLVRPRHSPSRNRPPGLARR